MATETERKFLVAGDFTEAVRQADRIVQGYLCAVPERTVRVRIREEKAFLTIKGGTNGKGFTRSEFEYEIPVSDAEALLSLCEPGVIEKVRHLVPFAGHTWEVDVFSGCNEGLVMAEIELNREDESFEKPDWLGEEVTGLTRYYNGRLSAYPYKAWTPEEKQSTIKKNI